MNDLPIRARLSLWYFAMFASAAALLSAASLWVLQRSVDNTAYHEMQEHADDVRVLLEREDTARSLDDLRRDFAAVYEDRDDGKYLQVRDGDGNWIYRSTRLIAENPELSPPQQLPKKGSIAEFRQGIHLVRVLAYPVQAHGKHYSVQTGISLDKSVAMLSTYRTGLLVLAPLVILLAGLGGHLMSRKALQPVAALAAQARLINDRNLDTRLPVPKSKDEISDLSLTLNQMLERIDKAFASVRAFTGNASHELRTPIALLRTEIEVALYREREADEYRMTLARLHEETVRLSNLVENMLSLARADAGAEAISLAPVNVSRLVERAERSWTTAMQQAMLDFRVEAPDCEGCVLGDAGGIQRLLSILFENASKYTPPGGSVTLTATPAEEHVIFAVRDTGIGISEDELPRIFDRFYRVAQAHEIAPRGSGLGLALAKWIAERHGTQLIVDSTPGRGSCFSFALRMAGPVGSSAQDLRGRSVAKTPGSAAVRTTRASGSGLLG
jgi:heavy metal sensor kinase